MELAFAALHQHNVIGRILELYRSLKPTSFVNSYAVLVDVPAADWMWRRVAASASWACRTSRCAIEPPRATK
jgi:hypothetical protein